GAGTPGARAPGPCCGGALGVLAAGVALAAAVFFLSARSRNNAPAAAPDAASRASRECTGHVECVKKLGGKPATCGPTGRCALVETPTCKAHYEPSDLERDDTVWLGAMYPLARFGRIDANAVELARRDFVATMGSYQPASGAPAAPHLALVTCDDSNGYHAEARHLVEDLGVPAILGFAKT